MNRHLSALLKHSDPEVREHAAALAPKRRPAKPMKRERLKNEAIATADEIAETARLRVAVFVGNDGMCAVHGEPLGNDWHMHHIEQGGLRKARQSLRNCAPVCERAHEVELHRHDLDAMTSLRAWCIGKGYTEAAAILSRRIEKVQRTRAAQAARSTTP